MVIDPAFWNGRRVLVTGHTGFKGSWLALWLQSMGARVSGLALAPPTKPSLFELARVGTGMESTLADIRDLGAVRRHVDAFAPEIVLHLAAQSVVRLSYDEPVETYATNVMGTVHVLEAVRRCSATRAVVIVTSDKCYENREWDWGYRENEPMGGHDPYSSSKACAELVTAAYRASFFGPGDHLRPNAGVASARAGNVIGGGDWTRDRLIPDVIRAFADARPVVIRNPDAVRPWQHVLEPLAGYLIVAQRLSEQRDAYAEPFNFGPAHEDCRPVRWIVDWLAQAWGPERHGRWIPGAAARSRFPQARQLARHGRLGWCPRWDLARALRAVVEWHKAHLAGADMREVVHAQIHEYVSTPLQG
jgi:CDP-glucose 4,6-dehydratase